MYNTKIGVSHRSLAKVAKQLRKNDDTPGLTASYLAKKTGLSRKTVLNAICGLRNLEYKDLYSNVRKYQGKNKIYYRLAA